MSMERLAAGLGLSAVGLFACALAVFCLLNPAFSPLVDYVSKLGAIGQPYDVWWNLVGFCAVGMLLAGFGFSFGRVLRDRPVGVLLAMFGLGFAATGIPVDLGNAGAMVSKAHVLAICLGLAGWLGGLARMAHLRRLGRSVHRSANGAARLVVLPIAGQGMQLWPMPVTHRLVFLAVFGWVATTSLRLLREERRLPNVAEQPHAAGGAVRRR